MDFAEGSAALGGIIIWAALAIWALSRSQGRPLGRPAARDAVSRNAVLRPAVPLGQDTARAERHAALAAADALGELHAEISAYRRAEQVLAQLDGDGLRMRALVEDARAECRYLGLIGEPICGVADSQRAACAGGTRCCHAVPRPA